MPPSREQKAIAVLSLRLPPRRQTATGNGAGLARPGANFISSPERRQLANDIARERGPEMSGPQQQQFQIDRNRQPSQLPVPSNPFAQLQTVLSNIGGKPGGGAVVSGGGGVRTQTRVPGVAKTGLPGARPTPQFGDTGRESITDVLGKAAGPSSAQLTGPVSQPLDFGQFNILGGAVGAPNPFAQLNNLLQTPRQTLSIDSGST